MPFVIHLRGARQHWGARRLETGALLGAGDDPLVAVALGKGLHAADVAAGEGLADREADELLAAEHLGHDARLHLGRAEVEHGRQADDLPREQAVDVAARPHAADFEVEDELGGM